MCGGKLYSYIRTLSVIGFILYKNKNVNQGLQMCEISKLNSPLKETKSMFLSSQSFLTWNDTFMYERPVRES